MGSFSENTPFLEDTGSSPETALKELTQLLFRLQQHIVHPSPERERRLRRNEYERIKAEYNLQYARSVLTKLEQDALQIKAPSKRTETQTLLNENRDRLETILDRLQDIQHMAAEDDEDDDDDDGRLEGEDLLSDFLDTPNESVDSTAPPDHRDQHDGPIEHLSEPLPPEPIIQEPVKPDVIVKAAELPPTQTSSTLRARPSAPSPSSHTSARAALFANRRRPAAEPQVSTATAEAILDQQRAEQDSLSESILKIAGALKASSQKFSSTLDADKDVLEKAGEGMSKTEQSMDAARGRMGALRRTTEGKGWWGRMMLYAWVYGMMLSLVLLVFVMPKLRF